MTPAAPIPLAKRSALHGRYLRIYRRSVVRFNRRVRDWLYLVRDAVLYGVRQQMELGRGPDMGALGDYGMAARGDLERAMLELRVGSLMKRFAAGPIQKADPTGPLANWNCILHEGDKKFGRPQFDIYRDGLKTGARAARITLAFGVVNERAVAWAAGRTNELVTGIVEETRANLRKIITKGIREGRGIPTIARGIREVPGVGLNARQHGALRKFGDRVMEKYSEMRGGLTPSRRARALKKIRREYNRKLRYRGEMIARTETARAVSEGSLEGYREGGARMVEFEASGDACPECAWLDGNIYRLDEAGGMIPVHPNCLTRGNTRIYTSRGWRPIRDVAVGDLVLTHRGRFRRVIQLHRNRGTDVAVTRIAVNGYGGTKRSHSVSLTSNHPVLVGGRWTEIGNVGVGDRVSCLASECVVCGGPAWYGKRYCKDCKHEAAHKEVRRLGRLGLSKPKPMLRGENNPARQPEAREKIRRSKLGDKNPMRIYPELSAAQSEKMKRLYAEHPEKHPNAILARKSRNRKGGKTWIEYRMKAALRRAGIDAAYNYRVGNRWIDLALVDEKIAVECDGDYWHQDVHKERERDDFLRSQGWAVLHFTGSEIRKDVDACAAEVRRVLKNHAGEYRFGEFEVVHVYHYVWKGTALYNLSVEDDESYVVKGVVVHNCRCSFKPQALPRE